VITFDDFRLFLHVLAATVWVGGQIVLAGLVPTVRTFGDDATRKVARAYNRIAWPAFGLIVFTGMWNLMQLSMDNITIPQGLFGVKMVFVLLSGAGALVHQMARGNKAMLAVGGAFASVFAALALLWGVALGQLV